MPPLVSICLPNLNKRPFLKERFDSIFGQTFRDWELFVFDSYSDDGSWEFIQELAKNNPRMRIAQGPREGVYPAWNECLRQTDGRYVYIATSDDGMSSDFLEKMVAALESNEDCELAYSPLVTVDEQNAPSTIMTWPESTVFASATPELLKTPHVRYAPYDGLMHLSGQMVLSITQLLVRRSIFSTIGDFSNRWGPLGDFHWEMKAGLVANTVYVPDTWATFRVYPSQATASVDFFSLEHYTRKEEMIRDAVSTCEAFLAPPVAEKLKFDLLDRARDLRMYYSRLREHRTSVFRRRLFQVGQFCAGSRPVRKEIFHRILLRPKWSENAATETRLWLESLGFRPLIPCSPPMAPPSGVSAIGAG